MAGSLPYFRVNDLVLIETQTIPMLNGKVAVIEEITGKKAHVNVIDLGGEVIDAGFVSLAELSRVTDPKWQVAHDKMMSRFNAIDEAVEAHAIAWKKRVATVAKRFGLSPKKVQDIYDLLSAPNMPTR